VPCMCGDPGCPSCGPAQGFCWYCNRHDLDGCPECQPKQFPANSKVSKVSRDTRGFEPGDGYPLEDFVDDDLPEDDGMLPSDYARPGEEYDREEPQQ